MNKQKQQNNVSAIMLLFFFDVSALFSPTALPSYDFLHILLSHGLDPNIQGTTGGHNCVAWRGTNGSYVSL